MLDFGIARFRSADLLRTESGVMLGTPAYVAPEQLRTEEVDARSDLYSLGMVLYEALAQAIEEKESRIAAGDIGGVLFAAPEFPPEVIEIYVDAIESHASGFRRLQETVTGYAGFVRIGARPGFHLLLVEERGGKFLPPDV